MKRIFTVLLAAFLCASPIMAQVQNYDGSDEVGDTEATFTRMGPQAGDQNIKISLNLVAPVNFPNVGSLFGENRKMSVGGLGSLGYHYFITDKLAVGADAGFGFNVTIGNHAFNYVPVVGTVTYQPTYGNFEFPLTMGLGFAWETYIGYTYFPGLVIKPEVGVHYRFFDSWTLGGDISYTFMPQFSKLYDENAVNHFAQFLTISVAARYYF